MNKTIKRIVSLAAVLLLLPVQGCEKKEVNFTPKYGKDAEFSISVVGNYANFESLEAEFERFCEYYPNGTLEYTCLDDYNNTVGRALLSDEAPDIFVTGTWMIEDSKFKTLFDSAEVLSDPSLDINLSCLRPESLNRTDSGDVVMLPVFSSSYGMLVNMDIFKKNNLSVPLNYKEFCDVCEKLKAAGYDSPVMGANTTTVSGIFYSFAYPLFCDNVIKNCKDIDALNSLDPSAGELLRPSLTRVRELIDSGYIDVKKCSEEISDDYNAVILRFFEGDVPMMLASGNTVSGTKKRESQSEAFTENPFEYRFFVAPAGDEGGYFLNSVTLFFSVT